MLLKLYAMKKLSSIERGVLQYLVNEVRQHVVKSDFSDPSLAYIDNGSIILSFSEPEYNALLTLHDKVFDLV